MKTVNIQDVDIETCLKNAQGETLLITKKGKPLAVLYGVAGMDLEQIELARSDKFWKLMKKRRAEKTMTRPELEEKLRKDQSGLQ